MKWIRQVPAVFVASAMVGLAGCSEPAVQAPAPAKATLRQQVEGPALLKDIDTRPVLFPRLGGSQTALPLPSGGTLVALKGELTGSELWKTDGTEAGTTLVKEFAPGFWSSSPDDFTVFQGAIYFSAESDFGQIGLWKSDGTAAGTVLVKSLSNLDEPGDDTFQSLVAAGGALYFIQGEKLWKSDGTEAGTVSIQSFLPETVSEFRSNLVPLGNAVYFLAEDSEQQTGLWRTDGTAAGTVLLKDLYSGSSGGGFATEPLVVGSSIYFVGGESNRELWKTDGTQAGTRLVLTHSSTLGQMVAAGPYLFFQRDGNLWRTDGTEAGTVELPASNPGWMRAVDGTLFFEAEDELGRELWKSDGRVSGTGRVKDLRPGTENSRSGPLGSVNGRLLLVAVEGEGRLGLWSSDGTEAGTVLLAERPGEGDFFFGVSGKPAVPVGSSALVEMPDFNERGAVFRTDGTVAGTVEMKSVQTGTRGSQLRQLPLGVANGKVFFLAQEEAGTGLWTSDATTGGTTRIKLLPNPVQEAVRVGSVLFLALRDETHGVELWKSDGTEAGTVLVKDIAPHAASSYPSFLTELGGVLYFNANDGQNGHELWKSDGTEAGTVMVRNLAVGSEGGYPLGFEVVNGTLFFSAVDEDFAPALWKSDGTEAGTVKVKDVEVDDLVAGGNTLYFLADDGSGGSGLWKSDGTPEGTVRIREGMEEASNLTWASGKLYFLARDEAHGYEPWVSDGTTEGTRVLKDIQPGAAPSFGVGFQSLGNRVLFFARDDAHGFELWRTDGTEAGTVRVTDLMQGPSGSVWLNLNDDAGNTLFELFPLEERGLAVFSGRDAAGGLELWATDGTTEGTFRYGDLAPGAESSVPNGFAVVGTQLFFFAGDAAHGREPRAVPLPSLDKTAPTVRCPGNVAATTSDAQGTTVEYPAATASDDQGTPTLAYSQASGTLFPPGDTQVTVTATDTAGNTAQCSFTVTVRLEERPPPPDEDKEDGCGCTSGMATGAGAGWGLMLLAFASLRARRRS